MRQAAQTASCFIVSSLQMSNPGPTFHPAAGRALRLLLPVAALAGAVVLFLQRLLLQGLILARGDTFIYFYPYWQAATNALRAGRLPLWNPTLFMGAPLLANSQMGFFYPLNWPLWLLLPPPYAVSTSIGLHLVLAGLGTYWAGRRTLRLSQPAALLAGLLFALGGYLTAQLEHVNQLQGLAWLPWYLLLLHGAPIGRRATVRRSAGVAALFTLQLLAGHTQTTFISGVGVGVWLLGSSDWRPLRTALRSVTLRRLLPLAAGALLALIMAGAQLLPTLELTGLSSRQGGLAVNEVLSFSLHPLLLGAALLPGYGQSIFSEYVAFLPLTALLLAGWAAWRRRREPAGRALIIMAALGLFLALGRFNPAYWLLARLPGFDLFRAPARWLALYALAAALLAGAGLDDLRRQGRLPRRVLAVGAVFMLALMGWRVVSFYLARWIPLGAESPATLPLAGTWIGWGVELGLALLLLGGRQWTGRWPLRQAALGGLVLLALFGAGQSLPHQAATTPEAYFDLRPPAARLLAEDNCSLLPERCAFPPGRLLSLSAIFFDPGDQAEIDTIYGDRLSPAAQEAYTVAIKRKEVIDPNLPLAYGLYSVDGFDGGILPLQSYTAVSTLLVPGGGGTTDGRLREQLDAVPPEAWLDLFDVKYVITDKVGDVWREFDGQSVFFDRQHQVTISPGDSVQSAYLPALEATEVWILGGGVPGQVYVGQDVRRGRLYDLEEIGPGLWRAVLDAPLAPLILAYQAAESGAAWTVEGVALVDRRDGAFLTVSPGGYRLIYSGDVKIYENPGRAGRALLLNEWTSVSGLEEAVAAMAAPGFDPRREAVVEGAPPLVSGEEALLGETGIFAYEPERVVIGALARGDSLLVLSDAAYPGWEVTVDGVTAEPYRVNGMFRGVFLREGYHEVVWTYRPVSVARGLWLSGGGLLVWLLLVGAALTTPPPSHTPGASKAPGLYKLNAGWSRLRRRGRGR